MSPEPPRTTPAPHGQPAERPAGHFDATAGDVACAVEPSFRHLAESLADLVWSARPDGSAEYCNWRLLNYLGRTPEQMQGWAWTDSVHPEDLPAALRAWERAQGTGEGFTVEHRLRRHDGAYRWHLGRLSPMREADARTARWFGTCTDIEDRRRDASDARLLAEIVGATPDFVAVSRPDGRLLSINRAGRRMIGLAEDADILGLSLQDLCPAWGANRAHDECLSAAIRDGSASIEGSLRRTDGREIPVSIALLAHRGPDGQVEAISTIARDLCERVHLEAEVRQCREDLAKTQLEHDAPLASLSEGEERFRALMEQAPFSIQILAPDGRTLRVNRAWEELWGVTLDQISDYNLLRDRQLETKGILDHIRRAFQGEVVAIPAIYYDPNETIPNRTRHDDPGRWVTAVAYPLKDPAGQVREVVLVHDDITERERAARRLRESEATLRTFCENSPVCMGLTEPTGDGDILHLYDNPASSRIFGAPPGSTTGKLASQFGTGPAVIRTWLDRYAESERAEKPVRFEFESSGPVGKRRFSVTVSPIGPGPSGRTRVCYIAEDVTERRRLSEQLEAERNLLDALLASTPVGLGLVGADLRYQRINEAVAQINGRPVPDHLGRTVQEVVPDLWPTLEPLFRRVLETGQPVRDHDIEGTTAGGQGDRRSWLTNYHPVRLGGSIVGVGFSVIDTTEPRRREDLLRAAEERLRLALAAGHMGTWDWDLRTGQVTWSDNLEEVHGLPPGGFDGTLEGFRRLVHPDDRPEVEARISRAIVEVSDYEAEFRIVRPDGSIGWMQGKGRAFPGQDGRAVRMIGVGMDITDRKRDEERLRHSEQRFSRFMQHLPGLAWIKDARGRYVYANDAAVRAFRTLRADLYGKDDAQIFPPETAAVFEAHDRKALESGAGILVIETLEHPDGTTRHSLVSKFPIPSPDGDGVLVGGMAIDMTDRLVMEEALKEADRRKGEFLATLAHELRNPLAPIQYASALMARSPEVSAVAGEEVAMIARQMVHLGRLVDDLMDLSRIERGRIELRRERVEISEILRRAVVSVRPALQECGHELTLALPATPIHLEADPARLEQVACNLLNNAIKYTESGGRLALETERQGNEVVIRVRDSGIGIPAEALPRIFQYFFQVEGHAGRSQGGLGIGLGLVQSLVELHGGSIVARSAGLGAGSEFEVRLPALPPADTPRDDVPEGFRAEGATAPARRRVLVVDDNRDIAESLAKVLTHLYGQDVRLAHDGETALAIAETFCPEVILLDIGLPGMDGLELARHFRARPESRCALIVALTGWGQEDDRRRTTEAGFDDHFVKPVAPEALRLLLAEGPPDRHDLDA